MNAKEYLGQAYRLDQHINDRLMQLSQLRALTPVSYTHLDVYKRKAILIPRRTRR